MTANSDPIKDHYDDMDFSDAKPVSQVPALAALQAAHSGDNQARITMRVDRATLAQFKAKAAENGGSYQAMMNEALKQYLAGQTLQDVVRDTIRQELKHA